MFFTRSKSAAQCIAEDAKNLIRRIRSVDEVLPDDYKEIRLFKLLYSDKNYVFYSFYDRLPSKWKGDSPEIYRVERLTLPKPLQVECNELTHGEAGDHGVTARFELELEVVMTSNLATWMKSQSMNQLSDDDLEKVVKEQGGLHQFLQKAILDFNLNSMTRRLDSELWLGQDRSMPDWIKVTAIRLVGANVEKTELELQCERFNRQMEEDALRQREKEERLKMEHEAALKALEREGEEEATALRIKNERELQALDMECERKKKLNQLELEELTADHRIAEENLRHQKEVADAEHHSAENAMRLQLLQKDLELRENQIALTRLEQEKLNHREQDNPQLSNLIQDLARKIARLEDAANDSAYHTPSHLKAEIIREQQLDHPVVLKKAAATNAFYTARDISMCVESQSVKQGTSMGFTFQSDRTGYLTLLCLGSSCQPDIPALEAPAIILLEPNPIDTSCFVEANLLYSFPGPVFLSDFQNDLIRQEGPAGVERLVAAPAAAVRPAHGQQHGRFPADIPVVSADRQQRPA